MGKELLRLPCLYNPCSCLWQCHLCVSVGTKQVLDKNSYQKCPWGKLQEGRIQHQEFHSDRWMKRLMERGRITKGTELIWSIVQNYFFFNLILSLQVRAQKIRLYICRWFSAARLVFSIFFKKCFIDLLFTNFIYALLFTPVGVQQDWCYCPHLHFNVITSLWDRLGFRCVIGPL